MWSYFKMHWTLRECNMAWNMRYFTLQNVVKLAILLCIVFNLVFLLYRPPHMLEHPCPVIQRRDEVAENSGVSSITRTNVNCDVLFSWTKEPLSITNEYKWCKRQDAISETDYTKVTQDCDKFRTDFGYIYQMTEEEQQFPLAFSILMFEQVEQTERLLRAIYRPSNFYCIHVDAKSPNRVHSVMQAIANCLPNVFISSQSITVNWAEFSVLEAELTCLSDLWEYSNWKYYINLAGREYPLRTNKELVKILQAYKGGNEVDGSLHRRPMEWTQYSWRKEYWRTNNLKSPPPHGFQIAKGSTHVAVTRSFVDYALHDQKALDLLEWMKDVRCPDEHFFPTLNSNPHLDIPGAYTADPDLRDGFYVRYKLWQSAKSTCHGKWVNFICVLGSGDLHSIVGAKHMFVNKLDLDLDPVAFQCLEQRYFYRMNRDNEDFDMEFYKTRKLVDHHV